MHRECHMNTKVRDKTGADGVDEFDLEIFLQNNPKHSENFITVNLDSTRTTCTINKTVSMHSMNCNMLNFYMHA